MAGSSGETVATETGGRAFYAVLRAFVGNRADATLVFCTARLLDGVHSDDGILVPDSIPDGWTGNTPAHFAYLESDAVGAGQAGGLDEKWCAA